jgi:hypothetical protein
LFLSFVAIFVFFVVKIYHKGQEEQSQRTGRRNKVEVDGATHSADEEIPAPATRLS